MQKKIVNALLSDEGKAAASALFERFKMKEFAPASGKEYIGLGVLCSSHGQERQSAMK